MTVMPNLLQILRPLWFSVVSFCLLYKYWQSNFIENFRAFTISYLFMYEHISVKIHKLLSLICIFMKLNHMRINSKMLRDFPHINAFYFFTLVRLFCNLSREIAPNKNPDMRFHTAIFISL